MTYNKTCTVVFWPDHMEYYVKFSLKFESWEIFLKWAYEHILLLLCVWLLWNMVMLLQDAEGPPTLCDLCMAQVCQSLSSLCSMRADGSMSLIWAPVFPQETADQLLNHMAAKGRSENKTALQTSIFYRYWVVAVVWQTEGKKTYSKALKVKWFISSQ